MASLISKRSFQVAFVMLLMLFAISSNAQVDGVNDNERNTITSDSTIVTDVSGFIFDLDKKEPLPYASVFIPKTNRGTVSNELGNYSINISGLSKLDTVSFQFIGYKTVSKSIADLLNEPNISLQEDIISLNEMVVFANEPDARDIVDKVVENLKSNYSSTPSKKEVFIRSRDNSIIDEFSMDLRKSSLDGLNKEMIDKACDNVPRNTISYVDFLCNLYVKGDKDIKVDPIKMVSLKEKDVTELDRVEEIFNKALSNTKSDEYWKLKTGIFSVKVAEGENGGVPKEDSLTDDDRNLSIYATSIKEQLGFSKMTDENKWEFLYSPKRYDYTVAGGIRINNEYVYVIDFSAKKNGIYNGRMYVSTDTYALIRADFEYAPGKKGTSFNVLGIGYAEKYFKGSIYFEKKEDNYALKYSSQKTKYYVTIDRKFALQKKRKRFLFDKKMEEVKIRFILKADMEESFELMIMDDAKISDKQFDDFKEPQFIKPIFVKQFDDSLWKDYDIIEPTQQMKNYKKHEDY